MDLIMAGKQPPIVSAALRINSEENTNMKKIGTLATIQRTSIHHQI